MNFGRWSWVFVVAAVGSLSFGCAPQRQDAVSTGLPGPCRIRGRVFDQTAHEKGREVPIVGAEVRLIGPALSGERVTHTDETGSFFIPFVPGGHDYRVRAEAPGYAVNLIPVTLNGGQTLSVDLYLGPGCTCDPIYGASSMLDYTQAN